MKISLSEKPISNPFMRNQCIDLEYVDQFDLFLFLLFKFYFTEIVHSRGFKS